jgi:hypothetical protein
MQKMDFELKDLDFAKKSSKDAKQKTLFESGFTDESKPTPKTPKGKEKAVRTEFTSSNVYVLVYKRDTDAKAQRSGIPDHLGDLVSSENAAYQKELYEAEKKYLYLIKERIVGGKVGVEEKGVAKRYRKLAGFIRG